jgi:hypothetical protein
MKKGVGRCMALSYSVLGVHFEEWLTCIEYEKPRRLVTRIDGPMVGTLALDLEAETANQTLATIEAEYEIGGGAIGRAATKFLLERLNEKNLERMIENMKMLVEAAWFETAATEEAAKVDVAKEVASLFSY